MRVCWVHEIPPENLGGAELTNKAMTEEGRRRGHDVVYIRGPHIPLDCDLYIINNITMFDRKELYKIMRSGKPYVRYEHDMGFCYYRDGACAEHCGETKCTNDFYKELFDRCDLAIFLSPLHFNAHGRIFPELWEKKAEGRVHLQPSPVTIPDHIDRMQEKQKDTCAYAGHVSWPKGADNLYRFARENQHMTFHVIGKLHPTYKDAFANLKNVRVYGHVKRDYALKVMASCEYFFHEPVNVEAYGRTVAEAMLLGCKIISNDRVGVMSYEDPKHTVLEAQHAQVEFWNKIEEVMHGTRK